jgi:translation initiation factor 4E
MAEVAMPNKPLDNTGPDAASATNGASSDIVTVFHDAENFNVKHPLANTWTLWFTKPPTGKVCKRSSDEHRAGHS